MSELWKETSMCVSIVLDPSLFHTGATGPRP